MFTRFTPAHRGGAGPPLLCLHGFTDTWRTWELVLGALERRHDVFAPTLPGHAGGPPLGAGASARQVPKVIEAAMDDAGFATAHIAGNSLGGYLALCLAARGRAESVVALAPAGGWAEGDRSPEATLGHFSAMHEQVIAAAPHAGAIAATPEGCRRATRYFCEHGEDLPPQLVAHLIQGAASCTGAPALIEGARRDGWPLDAAAVRCPVRIVWGTADRLLTWPSAAERYRACLPTADWVVLDDVGHCPQLDVPLEAAQLILGATAR
jgi:pimeloyl-ACP methyl ester carboxylesterase